MIYFKCGIVHRKASDTGFERIVIYLSEIIQALVVHSYRKHEMSEQLVRHVLAPRHLPSCLQRHFHIFPEEFFAVIALVRDIHIPVQEFHRLLLADMVSAGCNKKGCGNAQCQCHKP